MQLMSTKQQTRPAGQLSWTIDPARSLSLTVTSDDLAPLQLLIFSLVYPGPLHYLRFTLSYRAGRF